MNADLVRISNQVIPTSPQVPYIPPPPPSPIEPKKLYNPVREGNPDAEDEAVRREKERQAKELCQQSFARMRNSLGNSLTGTLSGSNNVMLPVAAQLDIKIEELAKRQEQSDKKVQEFIEAFEPFLKTVVQKLEGEYAKSYTVDRTQNLIIEGEGKYTINFK